MGHEPADHCRAAERRPRGEQKIERAPQAVNVGSMIDVVRVLGLLRGHEIDGPHEDSRSREMMRRVLPKRRGIADKPRQSQVQHAYRPRRVEHQIRRFDVAVDDPSSVRSFQPPRRLHHTVKCLLNGKLRHTRESSDRDHAPRCIPSPGNKYPGLRPRREPRPRWGG